MPSSRDVPTMRAACSQPPPRLGDLVDADAAGPELRRAARVDATKDVAVRVGIGLLACGALFLAASRLHYESPTPATGALATVLVILMCVAVPLRPYRAALRDASALRPGVVVAVPVPGRIVVRTMSGVWAWTYRRRMGMRELSRGERVWCTGRGQLAQAPTLVVASPVRGRDHVLWPTRDRNCRREPDPQTDRDDEAPVSYDDEFDS